MTDDVQTQPAEVPAETTAEREVIPVEAPPVVVVDPASLIIDPAYIPTGFMEINSIGEAVVERLALEHAFLDKVHKDFFSKTKLSPRQQRQREKNKRARASRRVNRKRAKGK